MTQALLKLCEVEKTVKLSRSSIYRLISAQKFPSGIRVGMAAVRWKSEELDHWLESRPRASGEKSKRGDSA